MYICDSYCIRSVTFLLYQCSVLLKVFFYQLTFNKTEQGYIIIMNDNMKQALALLQEVVNRDDNFWYNNMEDLVKIYQLLGDKGWDDFNQL